NKNVQTIAISLDFETDTYFSVNFPNVQTLTIQNIESYYNYRTIDTDFKLVTSIFSNDDHFIELKLRKNNKEVVSYSEYTVIPETKISDVELNFLNMRVKQTRVNCALNKIRSNLEKNRREVNEIFFDYFGLNDDEEDENGLKEMPVFCNNKRTKKKSPCSECTEICSLSLEMILHPTNPVSQADIYEELMIHHHPSSRIIQENENKRIRTTKEAAEELASHYMFAHKKKNKDKI
ncbi:unnamed protein product, partial [Brachionus calyciflorus]